MRSSCLGGARRTWNPWCVIIFNFRFYCMTKYFSYLMLFLNDYFFQAVSRIQCALELKLTREKVAATATRAL